MRRVLDMGKDELEGLGRVGGGIRWELLGDDTRVCGDGWVVPLCGTCSISK